MIYILEESVMIDPSISRRRTPLCRIHSVYATKLLAQALATRLANERRGPDIGRREYRVLEETLYGDDPTISTVYQLERRNGYVIDADKPYCYDNLGWFCSPYWAKQTKEWKAVVHVIELTGQGIIEDDIAEIRSSILSDQSTKLHIKGYKLYRE